MIDGVVLIDTCAWIDFFRNRQSALGDQVATLIKTDQAAIAGVIVTELLQGIRGDKEQTALNLLLDTVVYLEMQEQDWQIAGFSLQKLRQQGITVPLTDALIATLAIRHRVSLLTIDKHFQYLSVDLYAVPRIN